MALAVAGVVAVVVGFVVRYARSAPQLMVVVAAVVTLAAGVTAATYTQRRTTAVALAPAPAVTPTAVLAGHAAGDPAAGRSARPPDQAATWTQDRGH